MTNSLRIYRRIPDREFPKEWRQILSERVPFYKRLSHTEKTKFEYKIHVFLLNVNIVGIKTEITDLDRILVASGGVIPIFGFPEWHYINLHEVQIHPDKFIIPSTNELAQGIVGWGQMEGKMLLSRKSLYHGFADDKDSKNVAIHEFIHIIDKQDGHVDGVLEKVMNEIDILPWLELIRSKYHQIKSNTSTIRNEEKPNPSEFLAAAGEYFFENPDKMKIEHPKLYRSLDGIFNPKLRPKYQDIQRKKSTRSLDTCPCGSGKRFKNCCQRNSQGYAK